MKDLWVLCQYTNSPNELPSMSKLRFVSQVTLYHLLKLFQSDSNAMPKKTVVSEFYDEMVFLFCLFIIILNNPLSKCNAVIVVSDSLNWIWFLLYNIQIFQDPTAMMQQLLTTSRQLTLGAYKHETECKLTHSVKAQCATISFLCCP